MSFGLITFLFIIYLHFANSFIDLSYFRTFLSNLVDERRSKYEDVAETKSSCDSNQIMFHLAKKCITSPEKILLLLTTDSLDESCKDISDTMQRINKTQRGCIALPSGHLYMKLLLATQYFYSSVCQNASTFRKKMTDTMDCLSDLHDELLECEGPPDWYENKDRAARCSIFNDIIKCNYLKAAQICGLESGGTIRSFAIELLQLVQPTEISELTAIGDCFTGGILHSFHYQSLREWYEEENETRRCNWVYVMTLVLISTRAFPKCMPFGITLGATIREFAIKLLQKLIH